MNVPCGTLTSLKALKNLQITQNKCIRFCAKLDNIHHISEEDFKTINWLPVDQRVHQSHHCSPSYRNQSIDLQCKSTDWFLYDKEHWSLMVQMSQFLNMSIMCAPFI